MLLRNLWRERGETLIQVAAWGTIIAIVLGISGFVVLRARRQPTAASLTPDQWAVATQQAQAYVVAASTQQAIVYVSAVATQQADAYIQAVATQRAAAYMGAMATLAARPSPTFTPRAVVPAVRPRTVPAVTPEPALPPESDLDASVTYQGPSVLGKAVPSFQVYVTNRNRDWSAQGVIVSISLFSASGKLLWTEPVRMGDLAPLQRVGVLTYVQDPLHHNGCKMGYSEECWATFEGSASWTWQR